MFNSINGIGVKSSELSRGSIPPYTAFTVGLFGVPHHYEMNAVALNVTVVNPIRGGHVEVHPAVDSPLGSVSTLNVSGPGGVQPNFVIVPMSTGEWLRVYTLTGGHLIIDVLGFFSTTTPIPPTGPTHTSGRFQPLATPERWVDQRTVASQVVGPHLHFRRVRAVPVELGR